MAVNIFFCYAHEDEDLLNKLAELARLLGVSLSSEAIQVTVGHGCFDL